MSSEKLRVVKKKFLFEIIRVSYFDNLLENENFYFILNRFACPEINRNVHCSCKIFYQKRFKRFNIPEESWLFLWYMQCYTIFWNQWNYCIIFITLVPVSVRVQVCLITKVAFVKERIKQRWNRACKRSKPGNVADFRKNCIPGEKRGLKTRKQFFVQYGRSSFD